MMGTSDISAYDDCAVNGDYPLCSCRPNQTLACALLSNSELAELMNRMWTDKRNDGSRARAPQVSAARAKGRRCQSP